jgi:hypothetical protein
MLLGGAVYGHWVDGLPPEAFATEPPLTEPPFSSETDPPDEGPAVTDSDGGTLQVLEPTPQMGLVDTIVGDVVASFLGK